MIQTPLCAAGWALGLAASTAGHGNGLLERILPLEARGVPEEQPLFAELAGFSETFHHVPAKQQISTSKKDLYLSG